MKEMQVNVVGHQLKQTFDKAKNVLVILEDNANVDLGSFAACLVELFESYKKKTTLVTNSPLPEVAQPLVKKEQLKTKVDPKKLIISFDWTKNQLDKVSYSLEGDKFNLIVAARGKKIDVKDLTYSYKGDEFDLLVTIGVNNPQKLFSFGLEEETFQTLASVNFDKSVTNANFAKLNIVNPNVDSLSALAANTFAQARIMLPTKAAEILLYGIRSATANFSNVSDPATFEAAAYCKRSMIPGMVQEEQTEEKPKQETNEESKAPEGWMGPKIYRSSRAS